jgi:molecular chaperone HtpG
MYLLDSFTSGMYNDPLIVYREYIQNAVDSIDLVSGGKNRSLEVQITLEPNSRKIIIRDNASGIPAALAEEVLCSIGSSNKSAKGLRGFRGIGRLGGVAFCDKAVFRTKAKNESIESIQEWDCRGLRKLLAEQGKEALSLEEVFQGVTTFRQERCKQAQESYFEVTLSGVSSFRNQLFDIEKVRRYLSQVAPVPFNFQDFSHAHAIDKYLSSKLSSYGRYNIVLNGEPVHKPYKDNIKLTKGDCDPIEGIEFFQIQNGKNQLIACGWYGRRRDLLGSIVRGDDSSGIRVRVGNIQIGDPHLLDFCFRESRFNSYVTGEVHVECGDLIPNSRRDDFVDNMSKGLFYNSIEREVGLPISKEIRLRSRLASNRQLEPVALDKREGEGLSRTGDHPSEPCTKKCALSSPAENILQEIKGTALSIANSNQLTRPDAPSSNGEQPQDLLLETLRSICDQCPKLSKLFEALGQQKIPISPD